MRPTEVNLRGLQVKNTTFRGEEGFITFYSEAQYSSGVSRNSMTPLGLYLFTQGFNLDEIHGYLPPVQAIGQVTQNLKVAEVMESRLVVSGLYTQEQSDLAWLAPGHIPLLAFIDFVDDAPNLNLDAIGNVLDPLNRIIQSLAVRNLRLGSKRVSGSGTQGVQFTLDFTGTRVERMALNTQDASGNAVLAPEPVYPGGSVSPYPSGWSLGFGTRFGVSFGG